MQSDGINWDEIWQGDTTSAKFYASECLEVLTFQGAGRGVRTVAPLRAGELLLAERALAVAPEPELGAKLVSMQKELDDLSWCRLNVMCDGKPLPVVERAVPLRAWPGNTERQDASLMSLPRMDRIVDLNAYRCMSPISEYAFTPDDQPATSDEERHEAYGVFPLGSLFNHSCAPNMSKVLLADWVFLRAARDVAVGEELTQYYCDVRMPVEMRQKELFELFEFKCNCSRCAFELELEGGPASGALQPWKKTLQL